MAYGQVNYPNTTQGGGNGGKPARYTIKQVGCFVTSFCNLMERFGKQIDPPTMNHLLVVNKVYIDIDDGVKDDLGWHSISRLFNVGVTRTGGGAPPSNNCIVKFVGAFGTHFALVSDAGGGKIIDAYDGREKHWDTYGGPKAWAEYVNNEPIPVAPVAPAAPAPAGPSSEMLYLPAGIPAWAVYREGSAGRKGTSDQVGSLNTQKYGALAYPVLGRPKNNFVIIQTQVFGRVMIYVAPETNARIERVASAAAQPQRENQSVPVPAPLPEGVIEVIVQEGWGVSHVLKHVGYPAGEYGNADQWHKLAELNGKTLADLKLKAGQPVRVRQYVAPAAAPAPAPAPEPAPQPVAVPTPVVEPPAPTPAPEPPVQPPSDTTVPVSVTANPDGWKATFKTNKAGIYFANDSVTIFDLADKTAPARQLVRRKDYPIAGFFMKDGQEYGRTKASADAGNYYGIPAKYLEQDDDNDLHLFDELREAADNVTKDTIIKTVGTAHGKAENTYNSIQRFFSALAQALKIKRKSKI